MLEIMQECGDGIRFVHANFSVLLKERQHNCLNSSSISHATTVLRQQEQLKRSRRLLVSWLHCSRNAVDADTRGSKSIHP